MAFDGDFAGEMLISAKTGALARYFSTQVIQNFPGFGTNSTFDIAGIWAENVTNITSFDIVSTEALGIEVGSTFSLYRVKK